ncbi:thymidylate synthase [Xylocopilactobacillus apicola]|uniref:Thymidylate synthase n=1 Tax=Xylocopilactobacillus apicola TaxID=2932184 RepID=A0AAU9D8J2_9LACO|nr:thymidylate synthase [Xylocopilactobacillus apicola]BDR58655.1 thymidylate synthase [Xylocopilactobacillus apicola]
MSEKSYLELAQKILTKGNLKADRTGTGTKSIFGAQLRFNLKDGFPLLTTKKVPFGLIKSELLWFIHGDTNIRYLLENNNHIWDEWAFEKYVQSSDYSGPEMKDFGQRRLKDSEFKNIYDQEMLKFTQKVLEDQDFANKYGDLGNVYGRQWRAWKTSKGATIDQLHEVIETIKHHPDSRRMIVSAWNPEDVPQMALPPCHTLYQFYVSNGKLSLQLYQRSADLFLGVPFNIASYALLNSLIAQITGLEVGELIIAFGDVHIYLNHFNQFEEQFKNPILPLPTIQINPAIKQIDEYQMDDIELLNYQSAKRIAAPVAV